MKDTGPLGDSMCGEHLIALGTYTGEGKPCAAAALVNHGRLLDGFENALDGVFHRENEAGGELPEASPCIHQGRRVGHEVQGGHEAVEPVSGFLHLPLSLISIVALSDGPRHPPEELLRGFGWFSLSFLAK